jgi:hypothetical protein
MVAVLAYLFPPKANYITIISQKVNNFTITFAPFYIYVLTLNSGKIPDGNL